MKWRSALAYLYDPRIVAAAGARLPCSLRLNLPAPSGGQCRNREALRGSKQFSAVHGNHDWVLSCAGNCSPQKREGQLGVLKSGKYGRFVSNSGKILWSPIRMRSRLRASAARTGAESVLGYDSCRYQ
jgi:hypothetical protein